MIVALVKEEPDSVGSQEGGFCHLPPLGFRFLEDDGGGLPQPQSLPGNVTLMRLKNDFSLWMSPDWVGFLLLA